MYNSNTNSLGLISGVEVFFSIGQCSGALCAAFLRKSIKFQVTSGIERNPTLTAVCITNLTSRVSVLLSSLILDNLSIPIEGLI